MNERHETWLTAMVRSQQQYEKFFGPSENSLLIVPSHLHFVAKDFVEQLPKPIQYLTLSGFAFVPGPPRGVVWDTIIAAPSVIGSPANISEHPRLMLDQS